MRKTVKSMVDEAMAAITTYSVEEARDLHGREDVQFIDLREKGLSRGELASVARAVGGVRALYDAEGARVKERGLQHAGAGDERLAELLLADPLLLRTPIVRDGSRAAVGPAEATWKAFADAARPG